LMSGHHFSAAAFIKAPSASGVCRSRGNISVLRSASRACTVGSASASTTAALSLPMISLGVLWSRKAGPRRRRKSAVPSRQASGCRRQRQTRIARPFCFATLARRGDRAICGLILHPHFRAQSLLECERWRGRRRWRQ
jgi:hypothetical protein